jgi:serine/alanine adding enzyme
VREIAERGHEIACHGHSHVLPTQLTLDAFRTDICRARELLQDLSAAPVIGYRAPSFALTPEQLQLLAPCGYRYDSSVNRFAFHDRYAGFPQRGDRIAAGVYRQPDGLIQLELPMTRVGPFSVPISGGGYFRLYPGPVFRKFIRSALLREGHYVMYLHPWEWDPHQPRVNGLGVWRHFRHYNNLSRTFVRVRQLLAMLRDVGVSFLTAAEFVERLDTRLSAPTGGGGTERGERLEIRRLTPGANTAAWDSYVARHPEATAYHLAGWRDVIEDCFGHRTFYLTATRGGAINGLFPLVLVDGLVGRFLVSMPFLDYGGVLADEVSTEHSLTEAAIAIAREVGARHLEVRHAHRKELGLVSRTHKVCLRLELPDDPARLWEGLGAKLRSQIRRPQKDGCVARIGGSEDLAAFYRVFAEHMRDLGTPVYPVKFFQHILDSFPDSVRLCTTFYRGTPVAAGLLVGFGGSLGIQWGASLRRFNRLGANMLMYWTALEYACARGFRQFDFGRSSPGTGNFRFKEQWGARPMQLYWDYWLRHGGPAPDLNYANPRYRPAIWLWKQLPLTVANRLGPRIIRSIPA